MWTIEVEDCTALLGDARNPTKTILKATVECEKPIMVMLCECLRTKFPDKDLIKITSYYVVEKWMEIFHY